MENDRKEGGPPIIQPVLTVGAGFGSDFAKLGLRVSTRCVQGLCQSDPPPLSLEIDKLRSWGAGTFDVFTRKQLKMVGGVGNANPLTQICCGCDSILEEAGCIVGGYFPEFSHGSFWN